MDDSPLRSPSAGAPATGGIAARPASALTPRLWTFLLVLGVLWGGSFFFTQVALRAIQPFSLVALRVLLGAAALLLFLAIRGISLAPLKAHAGAFLVMGIANNAIPFTFLAIGQTAIGSGLASIINATTSLWTAALAALVTSDERMTANKLAGLLLGIAGVAVLVGPDALGEATGTPLWAEASILVATFSYAFAAVFAKRFRGVPPILVAAGQLTASSLVMVPLALLADGTGGLAAPSWSVAASVVALAIVSTAFAYILYFEIVAGAGATNASLVTFLVPASAILLGVLFLGEAISVFALAGLALILCGLAAVDGRLLKRFRRKP